MNAWITHQPQNTSRPHVFECFDIAAKLHEITITTHGANQNGFACDRLPFPILFNVPAVVQHVGAVSAHHVAAGMVLVVAHTLIDQTRTHLQCAQHVPSIRVIGVCRANLALAVDGMIVHGQATVQPCQP